MASGRPHRPKCASSALWEIRREAKCFTMLHNINANTRAEAKSYEEWNKLSDIFELIYF